MGSRRYAPDLIMETFLVLRRAFFSDDGTPRAFRLRDKRNTQDDPLDEHIHRLLSDGLPRDATCLKAPGPLITPDLVVMRGQLCQGAPRAVLRADPSRIAAIEAKKLERTSRGDMARASGMDYNTTPPCGTVRVYAQDGSALDIRGFYLFVCQESVQTSRGTYRLSALALCDGNLLNTDFDYYLSIVGERVKEVGVGSYADGANRTRPMLIFANPLGIPQLDRRATLIHESGGLAEGRQDIRRVGAIKRTDREHGERQFFCYRARTDTTEGQEVLNLVDPFPSPARTTATQARGRFRVDVRPAG